MQLTIPNTIPLTALARFAAEHGFTLRATPGAMLAMVPVQPAEKQPAEIVQGDHRGAERWAPCQ